MGAKLIGTVKKEKTFPLRSFGKKFGEIQRTMKCHYRRNRLSNFYFQNMTMLLHSVLNKLSHKQNS